jgi:thiol:disulfide interchange protein DsbA
MKQLISITTLGVLALLATACGNEETTTVDESVAVEAETPDPVTETTESPAPDTESLEVVEESAAEAEPEDQAIILAQAENVAAARNWQFREGTNYTRMIPTQPTVGGADKIEVAEVFMYSCPHCYDLESFINEWDEGKDPNVRLVRIPAIFNQLAQLHAQLYYTEYYLVQSGKLSDHVAFRNMVFEEFHRKGNRLTSQTAIQRLFARAGVSEDDFNRTWGSFEVNQALRVAADLARRYNVTSVPMIVVNGKYRTSAAEAGSYPKLIELIDELTVREGLR